MAPNPHWVAFSPDGTFAYTANHESNLITVLDVATKTVVGEVRVGSSPHSVAVSPTEPLVANVNYDGHSVSVIDTRTNTVTDDDRARGRAPAGPGVGTRRPPPLHRQRRTTAPCRS